MKKSITVSESERILFKSYNTFSTIVVEISEGRLLSHPELPELDPDFTDIMNYAAAQKKRVVPMTSEYFDVYYLFVRTDGKGGTFQALAELDELLSDPDFYCGTVIYMDRLSGDSFGIGEKILAKTNVPYVYHDGERVAEFKPTKRGGENYSVSYTLADMFSFCKERIVGQDEQLRKALYLIDRFVVDMSGGSRPEIAPNFFLTAPSGSGKTELYRSVKAFFREKKLPVPVVSFDLTQLTPAGYAGSSVTDIADAILSDKDFSRSGCAICFLDEADKKMLPSTNSSGEDFNAQAQTNLLRLLEGCRVKGSVKPDRHSFDDLFDEEEFPTVVDTSRVLFILMGSFQDIRDRRCDGRRSAGFGSRSSGEEKSFSDDITIDEMIGTGMLEEIAGRVSRVSNFHPVSPIGMRELLRRKAEQLGAERKTEIVLTERALDALVPTAYTRMGIRKPMNIISELADDALTEAAFSGELDKEGENVIVISSLTEAVFRKRRCRLPVEEEAAG